MIFRAPKAALSVKLHLRDGETDASLYPLRLSGASGAAMNLKVGGGTRREGAHSL